MKHSIIVKSSLIIALALCCSGNVCAKKSKISAPAASESAKAAAPAQHADYVFYFIGDGMGMGPVMATRNYMRLVRNDRDTLTMTTFPVASWAMTYSASSPITDSAAAGTALSTGHKTGNAMLGVAPDSTSVTSIARILKDKGWGVGVITTVSPDDATPGAFYAHVPYRKMFYEIGCQAAESGYDFIAGANLRGLTDKKGNPTGLLDVFAENKVTILHHPDSVAVTEGRVLLLAPEGTPENNVGYTIDSIAGALTLPVMTQVCLDRLEKNSPERFFMMVEGGNIDHALHGNDGGAAVKEIINFDQAIKIAYDFYKAHPDRTLIVITADHDTGGLALGNTRLSYAANLGLIDRQRVSKEAFSDYCHSILRSRRIYTWDDMKEYLSENLGLFSAIPVSADDETRLHEAFDRCFLQRNSADEKTLYKTFSSFAVDVFELVNNAMGFGFTTGSHTGNPVPVFAIGAGSEAFRSVNNNTEIPQRIADAIGL